MNNTKGKERTTPTHLIKIAKARYVTTLPMLPCPSQM